MVEVTIKRLGLQGDGIADGPSGDLFVPFSLPGEVVSGEVQGDRLLSPRIELPSDDRIKPPCSHFKSCGGCSLQHASDQFLADWKAEVVKAALGARDLETDIRPTLVSPPNSRRRATFGGRRTKKGALVGFHGRASDTLVAVPNCTLLRKEILAGVPVCEELTKLGASRKGEISISFTSSSVGLDVAVLDAKVPDGKLLAELGFLANSNNLARLSWNGETVAVNAAPTLTFGSAKVVPPSGGFLQATEEGQDALNSAVAEAVGDADKIVDLFAGCGTFALPLAKQADVLAVESDKAALQSLDAGWRQAKGLRKVMTEPRDLFRRPLTPDEFKGVKAVVIDPPRAGAKAQVTELCNTKIPRIAFVSCNPITFARDAEMLVNAGYNLDWIQVIDQFRWSSHVELVAAFSRA